MFLHNYIVQFTDVSRKQYIIELCVTYTLYFTCPTHGSTE